MKLSSNEIAEMNAQLRKESEAGRPEIAAQYRAAIERGEFYEPPNSKPKTKLEIPPEHGPGSKGETWIKFAKANSDLDEEIIEVTQKSDLITMLKANGIIPFKEDEDE